MHNTYNSTELAFTSFKNRKAKENSLAFLFLNFIDEQPKSTKLKIHPLEPVPSHLLSRNKPKLS